MEKLGLIDYQTALDYQGKLVELKQKGEKTDYFLLLEHNPVFTMGKGADISNILDKEIRVTVTNRGGDLTYHGPGQLIGYFIVDLKAANTDIHSYLRNIETLITRVLEKKDVKAYTINGLTGVWVAGKKVASIGIGVRRGIAMHGFALNIKTDLAHFQKINPCGLAFDKVSSLEKLENRNFCIQSIEKLFEEEVYEYL